MFQTADYVIHKKHRFVYRIMAQGPDTPKGRQWYCRYEGSGPGAPIGYSTRWAPVLIQESSLRPMSEDEEALWRKHRNAARK